MLGLNQTQRQIQLMCRKIAQKIAIDNKAITPPSQSTENILCEITPLNDAKAAVSQYMEAEQAAKKSIKFMLLTVCENKWYIHETTNSSSQASKISEDIIIQLYRRH